MSEAFRFPPTALPHAVEDLRAEVRAFLQEQGAAWSLVDRAHSWNRFDRRFFMDVPGGLWRFLTTDCGTPEPVEEPA